MTFAPENIYATCQLYPVPPTCQPSILALMTFLIQNLGHSSYEVPKKSENNVEEEYDFIIVGAGAAGCALANRLSEEENWKVLLLEAGEEQPEITRVPGFQRMFHGSSLDWNFKTEPERVACADHPDHRCPITQGRVMGGSSSLSHMHYSRGNKLDYDNWAKLGNVGWSSEEVFPYFLKSENMRDGEILSLKPTENFVWNHNHSTGGYLSVERDGDDNPTITAIRDSMSYAWNEMGFRNQFDCNGQHQLGVTRSQITTRDGVRQSSNDAFLNPIRQKRPNLVVKANAYVTRVIVEDGRAVGVEYYGDISLESLIKARARKEVVVSAGTFGSSKLLMLSGIGHSEELKKFGIKVIRDLPVGDNLHDHVKVPIVAIPFYYRSTVVSPDNMNADAAQWLKNHEGPLSHAGAIASLMVFAQSSYEEKLEVPDVQFTNVNAMMEDIEALENYNGLRTTYYPDVYYNAVVMYASLLNPKSRGTVRLNDTDLKLSVWTDPLIRLNYLTNEQDVKTLIDGASLIEGLLKAKDFVDMRLKKYERAPRACEKWKILSTRYLECMVKNYAEPALNFVGTCKMGPKGDPTAVVDPRLRVHGIKGLRVIDASVMPVVPRGGTYASTVMIAEKGSDMIKEDWRESNKSSNVDNLSTNCTSSISFTFLLFVGGLLVGRTACQL